MANDSGGVSVIHIIAQVSIGVVATYLVYLGALAVMNVDKLVQDEKAEVANKRRVPIIDGFIDASTTGVRFNTSTPLAKNYLPIRPSVNMKGGAQFTYSFWLFVDADASVANKTIFLKGDSKYYKFMVTDNANKKLGPKLRNDQMVFCPKVAFGADANSFEVHFNTFDKYNEVLTIDRIKSGDTVYRNNLISTLVKTWFMVTIVFEDNAPLNDFESGIMVKFYVNDVIYKTGSYKSGLKQNNGDLVLFPNSDPITNTKVSNFKYFNYALSSQEISKLVASGPNLNSTSATITGSGSSSLQSPVTLSDYNTLDIFNG